MDPTVPALRSREEVLASLPPLNGVFADFMTALDPYYSMVGRSLFNGMVSPEFNKRANFDQREYFGGQIGTYGDPPPPWTDPQIRHRRHGEFLPDQQLRT